MKRSILFLTLSLIFSFTAFQADAQKRDPAKKFKTKVKEQVPEFSYTTLDGEEFKISDHKGKVVWINFFATWCGPCVHEIPLLNQLQKEMEGKDAVILFVGRKHTPEQLSSFSKKMRMDESSVTADPDRDIYFLFAEKYIPRNVTIDKEGNIVQQATGFDEGLYQRMVTKFKELEKAEVSLPENSGQ